MSEMEELLPCPFCGSQFLMGQEPHDNHPVGGLFYIFHDYGPLGSPARQCIISVSRHFDTKDEAVSLWNTRPTFDEMREALQPFAENASDWDQDWIDKARAALSKAPNQQG